MRIAAERRRELHHRSAGVAEWRGGRSSIQAARQQGALQPSPVFGHEFRNQDRRSRHHSGCTDGIAARVIGRQDRRAVRRRGLCPAGARYKGAQRSRLENHFQLARTRGRVKRHHDGAQLGQGEGQDDEVGDVAQHQADPRAGHNPHCV